MAQPKSYTMPLAILVLIPLTVIGVMRAKPIALAALAAILGALFILDDPIFNRFAIALNNGVLWLDGYL